VDEVRQLRAKGVKSQAIGYKEINRYLDGLMDLETTKTAILKSTKRLSKKQKTWFKNQEHPVMLDASSPTLIDDALAHIEDFLKR
jgi:tRNA dimethylallyltransferase